jgi:2,5-diketo-D-gluconate reductase A
MMTDADTTAPPVPDIELNDGFLMPQLGFGVWQIENGEVGKAVSAALEAGYRLIDTAQGYDNEPGVGKALRDTGLDRSGVFVTTKLRTKASGLDGAIAGVHASLEALQLDYIDLMLIHWPTPALDTYVDTWKGLIEARADGLVRSIGVSNFLEEHLARIISETGVLPAVNQVETHPYFQQRPMRERLTYYGIIHEAYSPLGSGAVLDDQTIGTIAKGHDRSAAQVIIRWHIQRGSVVIPKSDTPDRIRENIDVFDFTLSEEEVAMIERLDKSPQGRTGSDPATFNDLY